MGWKRGQRWLACVLAVIGCATGTAARAQELHLNGPEYDALLTINGIPFSGALVREDAAGGWELTVEGTGEDTAQLWGVTVQREWKVSMALSKEGLTSDPNGRYTGSVRFDVAYDLEPFDQAAYSLVLQARGDGTDFDAKDVQGWFSHDESIPSQMACQWREDAFSMYISGLSQENTRTERSMQHTLSYLLRDVALQIDHRLYYDLPAQGEQYIYTMRASLQEEAIFLHLAESTGGASFSFPEEPVLSLELGPLLDALPNAQAELTIQQSAPL